MKNEILLESGTNEVEFLEFYLERQSFAINVAKIVQIIQYDSQALSRPAGMPDSMLGSLLWRERTIDLIDLAAALNFQRTSDSNSPVALITSFNKLTCGFLVDGVNKIHRMTWNDIQPLDKVLDKYSPRFTGALAFDEKNILLVDFEKIISELFHVGEHANIAEALDSKKHKGERSARTILFAEDSIIIRKTVSKFLQSTGYSVIACENGKVALDKLNYMYNSGKTSDRIVDIVLTDIEMPKLDGLTLCRKVKENGRTSHLPVIMFSSLINEQMIQKCREVGADDYLAKPKYEELIDKIDKLASTDHL